MLPPQGSDEVAPVVAGLRRIDARFDVIWTPRAVVVTHGGYDATGKLRASIYDGRWEVILDDPSTRTQTHRGYTRVCFVTPPVAIAQGVRGMQADGPYAPVGPWLVAFFQQADRANNDAMQGLSATLDAINAKADAAVLASTDDGTREACHRVYDDAVREGGVAQFHPVGIDLTPTR